ncbi:MAG: uroporphyrin-III C-methyltransferase [Caulobacteraceae bacterium]|nr:uroporphyrin-III C-methyltransferase [Caulobacteraceae bacterium]
MPHEFGQVKLVGAGPGAADLLTLRALRAIEGAQALLYDALVEPEVLALAPRACLRIQTGKRAGKTSMHQDEINALMLKLSRKGLKVVRLKGGDPSVFGRVGEEKMFLQAHGIDVEIVPGITAASAAAAQFGLSLTHRDVGRRLVLATASLAGGQLTGDWSVAADREASLAVYMGRDKAAAVCAELIRLGRPASTPAVAVENAGRITARAVHATLATLPAEISAVAEGGPVVLLIGEAIAAGQWEAFPTVRAA